MANPRQFYGTSASGMASTVFLQTKRIPLPSEPIDSLFNSSSSSFLGSRSMVSFEDLKRRNWSDNSFFRSFDQDENGDEDYDEYLHQPEKKRRLKADQVQFLEKCFELENKLEPERKVQLAKDLGLQPRQVAIWFQNRRARWKTKQLETDYDVLQSSYSSLKADYENLLKDNNKLRAEVLQLTDKLDLKAKDNGDRNSEFSNQKTLSESQEEHVTNLVSDGGVSMYEDLNSAKSNGFESDSSYYNTDGGHSSLLERVDSSYIFEPDHSDLSQDEEDILSKGLLHPLANVFPKTEEADDYTAKSCYFGFPAADDQTLGFWSY